LDIKDTINSSMHGTQPKKKCKQNKVWSNHVQYSVCKRNQLTSYFLCKHRGESEHQVIANYAQQIL